MFILWNSNDSREMFSRQKGSIRGMHFQIPPMAEIKIVKCFCGSVFDVMIDLRRGSSTFLKWYGEILSAGNMVNRVEW